jgi:anti-sigma regulatory factor (Ser/Thr protein kinase)
LSKSSFRHHAFVYDSDDDYVGRSVEFLRAGIEAGEGGLVAGTRDRLALVREGFDASPGELTFLELTTSNARPARALAANYTALTNHLQRFPAVRLISELESGPTPEDWREWTIYEAVLNRAFSHLPVWAICAYDARRLPEPALEAAWRAHPEVIAGERQRPHPYENPTELVRRLTPEPETLPELWRIPGADGPEALREQLSQALTAQGVEGRKALEMLIAANEVASNAWRHGKPPVELRVGRHRGRFVCEIVDQGPGFDDPLAGYLPPPERGRRAPGLWVARQLVWRLEAFRAPAGFTVRLWL